MTTGIKEYSATDAALAELRHRYVGVVFDVSTAKGMDAAKTGRMEVRGHRTSLEKMRVELKGPILEQAKLIDTEAKRITAELLEIEEPLDAMIKAEEARKAAAKAEKERLEAERLATIRQRIAGYGAKVVELATGRHTSAELRALHSDMEALPPTLESYEELTDEATMAYHDALQAIAALADVRHHAEAEALRLAEERAELARQQAEAQAQRETEEAERQRQLDLVAQQQREEAEKLAAERQRLDAAAEAERARKAAEEAAEQQAKDDKRLKKERDKAEARHQETLAAIDRAQEGSDPATYLQAVRLIVTDPFYSDEEARKLVVILCDQEVQAVL